MPKNFIHIAHKNFLTVQNNEKKNRIEPKVRGEKPEKHSGIGDAVSQTVGVKNTNGS